MYSSSCTAFNGTNFIDNQEVLDNEDRLGLDFPQVGFDNNPYNLCQESCAPDVSVPECSQQGTGMERRLIIPDQDIAMPKDAVFMRNTPPCTFQNKELCFDRLIESMKRSEQSRHCVITQFKMLPQGCQNALAEAAIEQLKKQSIGQAQQLHNNAGTSFRMSQVLSNVPSSDCDTRHDASSGNALPRPNYSVEVFSGMGSFILNLIQLLESAESMNLDHIISWLPDGVHFAIHDPELFLKVILPQSFR